MKTTQTIEISSRKDSLQYHRHNGRSADNWQAKLFVGGIAAAIAAIDVLTVISSL